MNPDLKPGALAKPVKQVKPMKWIPKISKVMSAANALYNRIARKFKREHPLCEACNKIWVYTATHPEMPRATWAAITNKTQDVHHSYGKLGPLRFYVPFFIPVCRKCHTWIDHNKDAARELGLLCPKGQYNNTSLVPK